jgi:hypothetical protein
MDDGRPATSGNRDRDSLLSDPAVIFGMRHRVVDSERSQRVHRSEEPTGSATLPTIGAPVVNDVGPYEP